MEATDDGRKKTAKSSSRAGGKKLPRAPKKVTVIAVGPDSRPQPLGHAEPALDAVHFVQVGRELVIAGTIEDLRAFVADIGMTVADIERDVIIELVEEGHRKKRRQSRQLA